PKEIADALNLDAGTVRQTCRRMQADHQLHAAPGGTYRPADAVPGDSGDGRDSPGREPLSLLSPRHCDPADLGEHQ
ncbi:DNA repair protein RadA, partial [Pseudonocardia sp. EV170527-09]